MNWVVWRQHRIEFLAAGIVFVFFTFAMLNTGLSVAQTAAHTNINSYTDVLAFSDQLVGLNYLLLLPMQILPLLLGIFIGAPLVAREIETGTFRLAWTQGITRQRWLLAKLALVGGVSLAIFVLLDLLGNWFNLPVTTILGPFRDFDSKGIVYIAYGLFALALGIAAGTLLGKTVPAMAITILLFLVIRVGIESQRPNYLPPVQSVWNLTGTPPHALDWVLSSPFVDSAGSLVSKTSWPAMCVDNPGSNNDFNACLQAHGIQQIFIYQPASRFWAFQGIESAIFLALTAGLIALTFYWVTHRVE